jgi:hypothetical protein
MVSSNTKHGEVVIPGEPYINVGEGMPRCDEKMSQRTSLTIHHELSVASVSGSSDFRVA